MRTTHERRGLLRTAAGEGDLEALATWTRDAVRHAEGAEIEAIVTVLLARWEQDRWHELADAIEHLSPALESPDALALRESEAAKISGDDWMRVSEHDRSFDRCALVETARRGSMRDIRARVQALWEMGPDPRISRGLARWLVDLPFRATSSQPVWNQVFKTIERAADQRVVAILEPTLEATWVWPCGETMQTWFGERVPALVGRVRAAAATIVAPDSVSSAALAELALLSSAVDLERLGDTEVDAITQARSSFEEAVQKLPLSWTDVLHHLEILADADDIELLVDRVGAKVAAVESASLTPPERWWDGLENPETRAHPALRLCKAFDLLEVPAKLSQPKLAKVVGRPELQAAERIHIGSRNLHKGLAAAILALPHLSDLTIAPITRDGALAKLGKLPALCARFQNLHVTPEWGAPFAVAADVFTELAAAGGMRSLERFAITGETATLSALADVSMPNLRQLSFVPTGPQLEPFLDFVRGRMSLEEIDIQAHYQSQNLATRALEGLSAADMPTLTRFAFRAPPAKYARFIEAFIEKNRETLRIVYAHDPCAALIENLATCEGLVELDLDWVEGAGTKALETVSGRFPRLRELSFASVSRTAQSIAAFFTKVELPVVETLRISGNSSRSAAKLGPAVAELANPLRRLEWQLGNSNGSSVDAIRALGASKHRESLRFLSFHWTQFGAEDLAALLAVEWPSLVGLSIGNTTFTNAMVDGLLASSLAERGRAGALSLSTSYSRFPRMRHPDLVSVFGQSVT